MECVCFHLHWNMVEFPAQSHESWCGAESSHACTGHQCAKGKSFHKAEWVFSASPVELGITIQAESERAPPWEEGLEAVQRVWGMCHVVDWLAKGGEHSVTTNPAWGSTCSFAGRMLTQSSRRGSD